MDKFMTLSIEEVNSKIASLQAEIKAEENADKKADLQGQLDTLKFVKGYKEVKAELATTKESLTASKAEVTNLEAKVQESKETQTKLEKAEGDLANLKTEKADVDSKLETANSSLDESKEKVQELTTEKEALQGKVDAYEQFINSKFGDETTDKFVANEEGGYDLPDVGFKQKSIKQLRNDRRSTVSNLLKEMTTKADAE